MKYNTTVIIITVAFIFSLIGFIVSVVMPQNNVSDALMIAALFCVASSGIVASVFTKKLARSKQWNYVFIGGLTVLLSFPVKGMGYDFANNMLKVAGLLIGIAALGHYIYIYRPGFHNSKWIWLMPLILVGCLFKFMHWPGGNIIIFGSLFVIAVSTIIQLFKLKTNTPVQLLLLVCQLVMCTGILIFYFRWVVLDTFIIGFLFTWIALVDILLQHENKFQEKNDYH